MDDEKIKLVVQVVGGILVMIAFLWNLVGYIWNYILSHLQIDISIEKIKTEDTEKLKVTTIVENKGSIAKKIDFAFLLINSEDENFKSTLMQIAKQSGLQKDNREITGLLQHCVKKGEQLDGIITGNSFALYTLPFFYKEQLQIGNEKVKYSRVIDLIGYQKNKVYNVRFLTISNHLFKTYLRYRSTSDSFIY